MNTATLQLGYNLQSSIFVFDFVYVDEETRHASIICIFPHFVVNHIIYDKYISLTNIGNVTHMLDYRIWSLHY